MDIVQQSRRFKLLTGLIGFIVMLAQALPVNSAEPVLEIKGQWTPGAMLVGQAAPGSIIEILDKEIKADSSGLFVFGLGRDITGSVNVKVTTGNEVQTRSYPVLKRDYDIQRIDGVAKKYVSPPKDVLARIRKEAAQVRSARATLSSERFFLQPFIWPAQGRISGVYGSQRVFNGEPKRPHYGLDIAGPVGTPVIAPVDGIVSLAVDNMYYSGGTLIVDHGYGISSTFIHLSKILVKKGQRVKQGDLIAEIGATGRVTGPHLDWRVNWFNQRLDPQLLVPERE